jgi:hypothetical protein
MLKQDLMQELKDKVKFIHDTDGISAVDVYLDMHHKLIPWEQCYECEKITPRDPRTLKCFFEEDHEF